MHSVQTMSALQLMASCRTACCAGNKTAVAELLQASIALDPHAAEVDLANLTGNNTEQLYGAGYDTTNATATRIAGAILGSTLASDAISQVLASAIAQGFESGTRGAAAIAIEAAVYSNQYEAVSQGFAQVGPRQQLMLLCKLYTILV